MNASSSSAIRPAVVVSEPRVIRSSNPSMTGGTGRVKSLTLIARYEAGVLASLLWSDPWTCPSDLCSSSNCINSVHCAQAESDCTCADAACDRSSAFSFLTNATSGPSGACTTSFFLGFAGTDADLVTLKSGVALTSLGTYSITHAAADITSGLSSRTSGDGGIQQLVQNSRQRRRRRAF